MAKTITFYYLSGSPYAWKVWLTLEHKRLEHDVRMLSIDAGDLRAPEFLAINPRGKAPVLVDGDFSLYESSAIVEYLEEAYPETPSIWPRSPKERATARRVAVETDVYLGPAVRRLMRLTLFRRADNAGDPQEVADAKDALAKEIPWAERTCDGNSGAFIGGKDQPSATDYGMYPWLAFLRRLEERQPQHGVGVSASLRAYMTLVERLPYFERTIPPHWKA